MMFNKIASFRLNCTTVSTPNKALHPAFKGCAILADKFESTAPTEAKPKQKEGFAGIKQELFDVLAAKDETLAKDMHSDNYTAVENAYKKLLRNASANDIYKIMKATCDEKSGELATQLMQCSIMANIPEKPAKQFRLQELAAIHWPMNKPEMGGTLMNLYRLQYKALTDNAKSLTKERNLKKAGSVCCEAIQTLQQNYRDNMEAHLFHSNVADFSARLAKIKSTLAFDPEVNEDITPEKKRAFARSAEVLYRVAIDEDIKTMGNSEPGKSPYFYSLRENIQGLDDVYKKSVELYPPESIEHGFFLGAKEGTKELLDKNWFELKKEDETQYKELGIEFDRAYSCDYFRA